MSTEKKVWELTDQERRDDLVEGLRKLATFVKKHGEELDMSGQFVNIGLYPYNKDMFTKQVKIISKGLGKGNKVEKSFGSYARAERKFSRQVSMDINISREQICERKVVGTKTIPERVIPAREEEIVEWECKDVALTK